MAQQQTSFVFGGLDATLSLPERVEPRRRQTIDERFKEWSAKNPHVVEAFISIACRIIGDGKTRVSARDIMGDMRRDADLLTLGDEFKCNNSFAACLSRLAEERCPYLAGKFEFRKRTSQK